MIQSRQALIYRLQDTGVTINDFAVDYQLHQNMNTEHCMALSRHSSL